GSAGATGRAARQSAADACAAAAARGSGSGAPEHRCGRAILEQRDRPARHARGDGAMKKLFALLALAFAAHAHAATGLYQICTEPTMAGHVANDCVVYQLKWDQPKSTDLVLVRPSTSTSQWDNTTKWQVYGTVVAPDQERTCPINLTAPATHGTVNGVYV